MRETCDEAGTCRWYVGLLLSIQDKFGVTVPLGALGEMLRDLTLRDIARALQRFLPQTSDAERTLIRLVLETATKEMEYRSGTRGVLYVLDATALDKPLLDSVDPNRWERAYPPSS
jgi:hypothetical protein